MAKIIVFLTFFSLLNSEIIEIENLDEILPHIDRQTWVLFNVDDSTIIKEFPPVVLLAQQSAGAVFGLTARTPPLSAATLKELAYIGIDFTFSNSFQPHQEAPMPAHWEGGVLFLTDFTRKGEVFKKWLEISPIRPSKLVIIDSEKRELVLMEKQIGELGIPATCFHYIKAPTWMKSDSGNFP